MAFDGMQHFTQLCSRYLVAFQMKCSVLFFRQFCFITSVSYKPLVDVNCVCIV